VTAAMVVAAAVGRAAAVAAAMMAVPAAGPKNVFCRQGAEDC
jgi:hypothetical protein